jgi:hypothetical protein
MIISPSPVHAETRRNVAPAGSEPSVWRDSHEFKQSRSIAVGEDDEEDDEYVLEDDLHVGEDEGDDGDQGEEDVWEVKKMSGR